MDTQWFKIIKSVFFICSKAEWGEGGTTFTIGYCVCEIADARQVLNLTWGSALVSPRQEMRKQKMWWPDVDTAGDVPSCGTLSRKIDCTFSKAFFLLFFTYIFILLHGCYHMTVHWDFDIVTSLLLESLFRLKTVLWENMLRLYGWKKLCL